MSALAKVVHRGVDGSMHYLSSTAERSMLLITDPKLGRTLLRFDGPCRLVPQKGPLPPGYVSVRYESISAMGSTTVLVSPGQEPHVSTIGVCTYCAFDTAGRPGASHDYELWPTHPGTRKAVEVAAPVEAETPARAPLRVVPEPEPSAEPTPEPAPEPVDDQVTRDARAVGKSVWFRSPQSRHELFQGLGQLEANARLERAVERGWVSVDGDRVLKGSVNPAPRMSAEPRSEFERMTAWGPGW